LGLSGEAKGIGRSNKRIRERRKKAQPGPMTKDQTRPKELKEEKDEEKVDENKQPTI
jgi:hypothetical protein